MVGSGVSWIWPFVDGAPPIGWDEASRYLVLPVLLVVAQFVSSAIITPPVDPEDDSAKRTQVWRILFVAQVWTSFESGLGSSQGRLRRTCARRRLISAIDSKNK
jgi:YidC/Oxa1 family membrane protein insertase